MVGDSTHQWDLLESWSPNLFLLAGVLMLGLLTIFALDAFADVAAPTLVAVIVGLIGILSLLTGLLGLYPRLEERQPTLAGASALVTAVATIGIFVYLLWGIAHEVAGAAEPALPGFIAILLGILLGFLLYGIAGLRSDAVSTTVGVLLLGFVVAFLVWAIVPQAIYDGEPPEWLSMAIVTALSILSLATGYRLRTGSVTDASTGPPSDATAR